MRFGFPHYLSVLASLFIVNASMANTKDAYDPAVFLQKQEFTESKKLDNASIQHSYVMVNGTKFRKFTTAEGSILIPLFQEILSDDFKGAKCTTEFLAAEVAPLTLSAVETKIRDQIDSNSQLIVSTINARCAKTTAAVNKKEADNKIKAIKLEKVTSGSKKSTPKEKEL